MEPITPKPSELAEMSAFKAQHLAMPMIVGGAILAVTAIAAVVADSALASIGTAAVLLLVMGIWKQTSDYVVLHADYLTAKPAPAAARKAILYSEILGVTRKGTQLTIEYRPHTQPAMVKPGRLRLRLGELMPDQRSRFIAELRNKLPQGLFPGE